MSDPTPPTGTLRLPDDLAAAAASALQQALEERWTSRIWDRDTGLWSDQEAVQARIGQRLGWLDAPAEFRDRVDLLEAFAEGARSDGFTQAVVCGMGGSSLAPAVLGWTYGRQPEGLEVRVLDSTDPAAVAAVRDAFEREHALYVIASKSGTTTEPQAFLAFFWGWEAAHHEAEEPRNHPGHHFLAVTDPDRSVRAIPHSDDFREVFLNPPDIGGRYSALSYVGLVPGALQGIDLRALLDDAILMADACREEDEGNPGLVLGTALGALARAGRDKLTFVIEPRLQSLGMWLEQLLAESTGKQGRGIVPVDLEPLGPPQVYGSDRVFVRVGHTDEAAFREATDEPLAALAAAGHPVIDLLLEEGQDLGGEFFRWEFATAVAGAVLGIDPFDEPNVTESKENTRRVLAEFAERRQLPTAEPLASEGPLALYGDAALRLTDGARGVTAQLARHLGRLRPDGYLALQAYLAPTPERDAALRRLRLLVRERMRRATTAGYGPRFLHSTGQLHKGGPRSGCFLQLTAGHPLDLPIPGWHESFGVLIDAQALGDMQALEAHELPVLRVHLGNDPDAGLAALEAALARALSSEPAG